MVVGLDSPGGKKEVPCHSQRFVGRGAFVKDKCGVTGVHSLDPSAIFDYPVATARARTRDISCGS